MYNTKALKYYEQGRVFQQEGKLSQAENAYKKAIKINDDFFEAYNNLGNVLKDKGRFSEAINAYKKSLKLLPDHPMLLNNLGSALQLYGQNEQAIYFLDKAINIDSNYADALSNKGNALIALDRPTEAYEHYTKAITLNPDNPDIRHNLGELLLQQGKFEEAIGSFVQAIRLNPRHENAFNGLGTALFNQQKFAQAAESYRKAIEIDQKHKDAFHGLGNALSNQGNIGEAIQAYSKAINNDPHHYSTYPFLFDCYRLVCDWKSASKTLDKLSALNKTSTNDTNHVIPPFIQLYTENNPSILLSKTKEWCDQKFGKYFSHTPFPTQQRDLSKIHADAKDKIRLGYISNDFKNHPVGILIHNLFKHHDRTKFEVFIYSYSPDNNSRYRQAVVSGSDHFRDISSSDYLSASSAIHNDEIDILVDLTGFTTGGRTEICAYKPAPIQINYLGFPGSSGSDFFDYLITDWQLSPSGFEQYFTEKLIRLPDCYQVNSQILNPADKGFTPSDFSIPEDAFVFCSFNNPRKIDEQVFKSWMRILSSVDDSILWLYEKSELQRNNLRKEADNLGIDPDRLIFAKSLPIEEHIARHVLADIALDPFNYNGGITTSLALFSNVPVVTLQGNKYISRMSSSLLNAVSLQELITHSVKEYEETAIRLASDKEYLRNIKCKLALNVNNGPLFDTSRFCKNLEKSFEAIWNRHIAGEIPDHINVQN